MNQTQVRFLNDGTAPNAADTWMIYQALAGVWPATLSPDDAEGLKALETRFLGFLEKALREAKQRTDWIDSNESYESVVLSYARHLLSPDNTLFLHDFSEAMQPFIRAGLMNSLSQTAIKLTAPGVPDIYQGSEALNFSLVDPDNRREPDFPAPCRASARRMPGCLTTRPAGGTDGSNSLLPPRCCGFDRTTTRFSATATGCRLRSPASGKRT